MTPNYVILALLLGSMGCMMVIASLETVKKRGRAPSPEPPPLSSRTSNLAGFSFFFGLVAILMVTTAAIMNACVSMNEITGIPASVQAPVQLAARIVLYVSLLPAVGAVALALAARGSINESRGALRGRALYRSAFFLSILSGV